MIAINGTPETHFKETEVGLIPVDWEFVSFQTCISNRNFNVGKIKARDYLEFGNYPIIDQSQDFIAGYWDDNSSVYDGNVPIIIFGDHTRIFKFIDFRFVCGADGTKIIQPNTDLFDPLFLFFVLQNLEIPNKGYNRHYTVLKEKYIQCPPLPEQRRIATVLNTIQDEIAVQDDILHELREFKRSTMERLFTYGAGDTPAETKMTEVGEIPAHWEVVTFQEVEKLLQYGTSQKCDYDIDGYPVMRIPNVLSGKIDPSDMKYTAIDEKSAKNLVLKEGDLLFVRTNGNQSHVGRSAVYLGLPDNCLYASYLIRLRFKSKSIYPRFAEYYVSTSTGISFLSGKAIKTADGKFNINMNTIRNVLIPRPPYDDQEEIVNQLTAIDEKIATEEDRKSALQYFFRSTLQQLMTGQIRLLSDEGLPL